MEILSYSIIVGLLLFSNWRFTWFKDEAVTRHDFVIAWLLKIGYSVIYLFVFCDFYGKGNLYGDAYNFMNDSRLLNEYAYLHPANYVKIMLGWGDTTPYFTDALLQKTNLWSYGNNGDFINDNRLIIRINSLIHFFSFGSIYVHALVMSALSFFGIILLYKSLSRFVANKKFFFYTLILFPSIGFWGSGITKEALLIFAIGLFSYGIFRWGKGQLKWGTVLLISSLLLLLFNKPHVGLTVIGLFPLLILGKLVGWKKWLRIAFPGLLFLILIGLTFTPTQINLLDKVSYKQKDLINMGKGGVFFVTDSSFCAFDYDQLTNFEIISTDSLRVLKSAKGEAKLFGQYPFAPFEIKPSKQAYAIYLIQPPSGSYLPTEPINYSRKALFSSIPTVLFNTLIRPIPGDHGSNLKYFSMFNNLLLFLLMLLGLMNRKKLTDSEKYVVMYLLLTSLVILLIIGWTTPILGAIARYKMVVELFIVVLLSIGLKPLFYVKK